MFLGNSEILKDSKALKYCTFTDVNLIHKYDSTISQTFMAAISFHKDFDEKTCPFLSQSAHVVQQTLLPTKAVLL
jgi:hypothetical protein